MKLLDSSAIPRAKQFSAPSIHDFVHPFFLQLRLISDVLRALYVVSVRRDFLRRNLSYEKDQQVIGIIVVRFGYFIRQRKCSRLLR